eukprot:gene19721-26412_t
MKTFPTLQKHGLQRELKLDYVARYSATPVPVSKIIIELIKSLGQQPRFSALDMFGGGGADAITFLLSGAAPVHVIEKDATRALNIGRNIGAFIADGQVRMEDVTVWNADSIYFITGHGTLTNALPSYDVIYMDAPWGGPDYKKHKVVDLKVSGMRLSDIVQILTHNHLAKNLIVLKVPFNQDMSSHVFKSSIVYDIFKDGRVKPFLKVVILSPHHRNPIKSVRFDNFKAIINDRRAPAHL